MSVVTSLALSSRESGHTDPFPLPRRAVGGLQLLGNGLETEVLNFLRARPIHTVIMAGYIRDNGLVSERNRGSFYCHRNGDGRIDGVALIGHATLFEARCEGAVYAFARLVNDLEKAHLIMGEQRRVEQFWRHLAQRGDVPHEVREELLFAREATTFKHSVRPEIKRTVRGLRLASRGDLEIVTLTHARMAVQELGLDDPFAADPDGFVRRCAQRIDLGRVWVLIEDDKLVFKADVISETPEATYLEGIYVDPNKRGQGYGLQCLSLLSEHLLNHSRSICLFVNKRNSKAHAFYRNLGFRIRGHYTTIFLRTAKRH